MVQRLAEEPWAAFPSRLQLRVEQLQGAPDTDSLEVSDNRRVVRSLAASDRGTPEAKGMHLVDHSLAASDTGIPEGRDRGSLPEVHRRLDADIQVEPGKDNPASVALAAVALVARLRQMDRSHWFHPRVGSSVRGVGMGHHPEAASKNRRRSPPDHLGRELYH